MARPMTVAFAVLLCDILSFAILLPLLPSVIGWHKASSGADGLFATLLGWARLVRPYLPVLSLQSAEDADVVLMGGLLGSMSALLQLHASLVVGRLADKWGRRPLVLLCAIGSVASIALWLFADTFALFVLSRIVSGMSRGLSQLTHTIASDVSSPLERTRAMAMLGAAFSLGFVFGPLIGSLLSPRRTQPPFLQSASAFLTNITGNPFALCATAALLFALAGLALAAVALKETRGEGRAAKGTGASGTPRAIIAVSKSDKKRAERLLGWTHFGFLMLFAGVEFNLTFYLSDKFAFSSKENGQLLAVVGIVAAVLQAVYVRRFQLPEDVKRICGSGLVAFFASLFFFGFAATSLWAVGGALVFAYASAVVVPTMTSLVTMVSDHNAQGAAVGKFRAFGLAGRAVGPLVCSFLYWAFGPTVAFVSFALLLFAPMVSLDRAAQLFIEGEKPKKH